MIIFAMLINKLIFMKKFILTLGLIASVVSCSDRTEMVESTPEVISKVNNSSYSGKRNPVGVVASFEFTYGRQSKGCHGFGVCELVAFGFEIIELPPTKDHNKATIYKDATGELYALYTLNEKLLLEDKTFYIDEDIIGIDKQNATKYIIKAGNYQMDPTLGQFGGYDIKVEKVQ